MAISMAIYGCQSDMEGSMVVGYAAMIVAFSFVFVGIKNYRDKYCDGVISFGKAFKLGLYITLIASTMYVTVWLIEYYFFMPDFMEKYAAHIMKGLQESGVSQVEMDKKMLEMQSYKDMYKNPLFIILLTNMEILPIGILITIISALILKKKTSKSQIEIAG